MKKIVQVVLALALLLPAAAWTQQNGAMELKSVAEVEVISKNEKGETMTKRVEVAKTKTAPGDTVIFTTHYTNKGKQPATDVVITNPIDEHMAYVEKSAEGSNARIDFSMDNGKTYHTPEKLTVKNAQGLARQARAEEYTNIRWTLIKTLSANGIGSVSFKAKIR